MSPNGRASEFRLMRAFLSNPKLRTAVRQILPNVRQLRRAIHANPEEGYRETGTTSRIRLFLEERGVPFCQFDNMTGGYVYIDCGKEHTAGFRADIDALPIEEKNEVEYKSVNKGIMHACGHDIHAAVAAGLAVILTQFQEWLEVNILIIFQPAEECNPTGGAKAVIAQGIFETFGVKEFYGMHVWPELKVGEVAVKPGAVMASSDKLMIRVTGKKAHAAEPQKGVDAISIAAEIINAVEHKIRREISPFETVLVSIGSIKTTGRYNIICDEVLIEGTIRSLDPEIRKFVHRRIEELADQIATAYRGFSEVIIENGYAVVHNDKVLTEKFLKTAGNILGKEMLHTDFVSSLIGEDFSFYGQVMPAMYFFMGCESEFPLHNEKFLPREDTLDEAIALLAGYFTEGV